MNADSWPQRSYKRYAQIQILVLILLKSPATTSEALVPRPAPSSTPSSALDSAMSTSSANLDTDLAPPSALQLPKSSIIEEEAEDETVHEPKDPNAIPELSTFPANDDASRIEALRLIADSVAQQRQRASRALIFHPLTFGLLAISAGALRQYFYRGQSSDYAIMATTFFGILMAVLVAIRARTGAYLTEAERVGTWKWLSQGRSVAAEKESGRKILGEHDDEILVTKFGNEYIGAIIFRGVQSVDESAASSKKTPRKTSPGSQPKTEIRGWSVRQRYRGRGVGTALLEDAIRTAHERGWSQGGIEIATDHANNKIVLPPLFSGFVQANDEKTRKYVEKKVNEYSNSNRCSKEKGRR